MAENVFDRKLFGWLAGTDKAKINISAVIEASLWFTHTHTHTQGHWPIRQIESRSIFRYPHLWSIFRLKYVQMDSWIAPFYCVFFTYMPCAPICAITSFPIQNSNKIRYTTGISFALNKAFSFFFLFGYSINIYIITLSISWFWACTQQTHIHTTPQFPQFHFFAKNEKRKTNQNTKPNSQITS